jgi:hypothetical protein
MQQIPGSEGAFVMVSGGENDRSGRQYRPDRAWRDGHDVVRTNLQV